MSISATHNAIMEAGGKDRAPLLVTYPEVLPTDYHLSCLTETKLETYSIVGENTKKRIDAKVKAVHIVLIGIDNDIYSTVDACANAKEMWIAIECLMLDENINKQEIARAPSPRFEFETKVVSNEEDTLRDKEINKLIALISTSFKRIYKPTNNNLRTSSNTKNKNVDSTLRIRYKRQTRQYETHWAVYVVGNKDTIGHQIVQNTGIQCYNCKGFRHTTRCDSNTTPNLSDMSNNGGEADQDEQKFQKECALLASLIEQMKVKIDKSKRMNKSLEASNKVLESSNKALEASKKFLAYELKRYKDMNFVKKAILKCAQANGLVKETKIKSDKKVFAIELEPYSTKQTLSHLINQVDE
ncbi:hypothetical protein Tco_0676214 [Tanacetum coccineum]